MKKIANKEKPVSWVEILLESIRKRKSLDVDNCFKLIDVDREEDYDSAEK